MERPNFTTTATVVGRWAISAVVVLGFTTPSHALISVAELNARKAKAEKKANAQTLPSPIPSSQISKSDTPPIFRVVLDPGHGGIDQGASFGKTYEKDVTLSLAKHVAAELRSRNIDVVLTRETDREMPLSARTALANKLGADVFISLHMNSTPTKSGLVADGTETYILNNATDDSSRRLAQLENMVMAGKPGEEQSGEATDVSLIIKDLRLDANLPESKRLACMLQTHLVLAHSKTKQTKSEALRNDRGVRQALFFVLLGADMPSALVETGFLSNADDRAWVTSDAGQRSLGVSIARAINLFRIQKNTNLARTTLNTCKVH